jgi:hypothetical protein
VNRDPHIAVVSELHVDIHHVAQPYAGHVALNPSVCRKTQHSLRRSLGELQRWFLNRQPPLCAE